MSDEMKKLLLIAFSCGYHSGHHDTVEGVFLWCDQGTRETAADWLEDALKDGTISEIEEA